MVKQPMLKFVSVPRDMPEKRDAETESVPRSLLASLAKLVSKWEGLPPHTREAILTLVDGALAKSERTDDVR